MAIRTLGDMLLANYGNRYTPEALEAALIKKTTGTISTSSTNYRFRTYGRTVYLAMNLDASAYGLLNKSKWGKSSGWRLWTDVSRTLGSAGIAETGTLSDAVYPSVGTVYADPKQIEVNFAMSNISILMSDADDSIQIKPVVVDYMADEFKKEVNKEIIVVNTTATGNNFTSLDKIVCSNSEVVNCGLSAGDGDIYGNVDRDTSSTITDSIVLHNSGTNRALTLDLLRSAQDQVMTNGAAKPGDYWMTGPTTRSTMASLFTEMTYYVPSNDARVSFSKNGVETVKGMSYGENVAMILGVPVFIDYDVPSDGSPRIYLLNTTDKSGNSILEFAELQPVRYYESNNFLVNGSTVQKGMFYMAGEVRARILNVHAKIRDLS